MTQHVTQYRRSAGPGSTAEAMYAPHRDLAYLYPNVVATAEELLRGVRDPFATSLLKTYGATDEDLAEAVRCFCLFLNGAADNPKEDILDVLDRVKFNSCHPAARIMLMNYIGTVLAANAFSAARDVALVANGKAVMAESIVKLLDTGRVFADYQSRSRLGRWWFRLRRRFQPKAYDFITG
jgi:hypothetical protein